MADLRNVEGKHCTDCGEWKPLSEFPFRPKPRDQRSTYCKPCSNARSKASYYKKREAEGRPVTPRVTHPEGHKRCPDCGLVLPFDQFAKNRSARDGLSSYCKQCHNARAKASVLKNHGTTRTYHLKRRYGITAAEYDVLLREQGGLCAVCRERPAVHVDHCHQTGMVRGLTCFNCNGGLGQFRDRVDIMRRAIDYLERTGTPQCHRILVAPGVYQVISRPSAPAASRSSSLPPRRSSSPPV